MNYLLIAALWAWFGPATFAGPLPLAQALAEEKVRVEISGNGRDAAALKLVNTSPVPLSLALPAGSVLQAKNGERQVTLRAWETQLSAGVSADVVLPTAALTPKNTRSERALTLGAAGEPRLAPLLPLFARNDLPRPTAQLAVFIVLEDLSWPAWRTWSAAGTDQAPQEIPTPAEVAQAVDALALVRLALPESKPALLASDDLKRLALRNPWARDKAMTLYGLTVENAATGDPASLPDLKQLLHISPNDNCPVCRLRQKMEAEIP